MLEVRIVKKTHTGKLPTISGHLPIKIRIKVEDVRVIIIDDLNLTK